MSKQEKYAYLLAICSRYAGSGRAQKAVILDEYCASTHLGRKYAITQLRRPLHYPLIFPQRTASGKCKMDTRLA